MLKPPSVAVRALVALLVALLAGLLVLAPLARVEAQPPQKFENLKVLPKNIAHDSLVQVMRAFSLQLGVRCTYCHVAEPRPAGAPADAPEKMIFKADDKIQKRKARFMMQMVAKLNDKILPGLPGERHDPRIVMRCVTCHRGSPLPQALDAVLTDVIDKHGVDSAIAQYKDLREDMESGRYDFSEWSVNELARILAGTGKTDAAIAMLEMNQEYNPKAADIDYALGGLYLTKGDKDKAIAHYRAALSKRPQEARFKRKLDSLGVAATG
jgi:tetratricopeptide (TPR) repeat protein